MIISRKKNRPVMYEINTRILLKRFTKSGDSITLKDIPDTYWRRLAAQGIDFLWLMGIWQTADAACKKYCFTSGLMSEYSASLPDWDHKDIIGSPYAIDTYSIHTACGTVDDIMNVKKKLNELGMKLILDFVPNHYSACSRLLEEIPEIFMHGEKKDIIRFPQIFFSREGSSRIFAHGRDPYFDPWQDTVQVNTFSDKARQFLIKTMLQIASLCDGVRCDMAMLLLNDIFFKTWQRFLPQNGKTIPAHEFWDNAIGQVREVFSDFLFIAEAYWDTGWQLQQMGFDYTYDKELYDRLRHSSPRRIREHLMAEKSYQQKSLRFIENHDEQRSALCFGEKKSMAAAAVITTIPGLCFFHDGQYEGKKVKLPVQLGREKREPAQKEFNRFYLNLLRIRQNIDIQAGTWHMLYTSPAWEGNNSYDNYLTWMWVHNKSYLLVAINYAETKSQCRIYPAIPSLPPIIIMTDLLGGLSYRKDTKELSTQGLFIEREGFESHIFYFKIG